MILKKEPIGICDSGSAEHKEDRLIKNFPFYGVIDAFSEPHGLRAPLTLFDGKTGGEIICDTADAVFHAEPKWSHLESVILVVNRVARHRFEEKNLPVNDAGRIPGASFIFAKIEEELRILRLIGAGDCLAVWSFKSGEIGFIRDKAYAHVAKNLLTIRKLREKGLSTEEMWIIFAPILARRRLRDINQKTRQGYASLNGQLVLKDFWQKVELPINELDTILLFSDGYFHAWEASSAKIPQLAMRMLKEYRELGLREMLEKKRREEETNSKTSYIKHDEATAIPLEF